MRFPRPAILRRPMPPPRPIPPNDEPADQGPTVTTLACPKCAAPLPAPGGRVRFLTCDHCGATVRLRRSGGTITAKRVRALGRRVDGLSRAVRRMRIEEKLADLDDRWNRRRATLIDGWDEQGTPQPPDRRTAVALTTAAGLAILYGAATSFVADLFPWSLPLWGGVVLLAFAVPKWVRAERFLRERGRYRRSRADLVRDLGGDLERDPERKRETPARPRPAAGGGEGPHDWPVGWPQR